LKPKHELSEIVHNYGKLFLQKHPQTKQVLKTLDAIARCRTASLGGHKSKCNNCGHQKYFYNSCRNRHCPKCQAVNRERWIAQREAELLPVPYFHLVFTLPHQLNDLAEQQPKEVYNALFYASWQTIKTFAADPKHLGAKTGMVAVLHTWGQQLWLHPHLHCIVPGGGITKQGKWKSSKQKGKYLFPSYAMAKVYRAKFVARLGELGIRIPPKVRKAIFKKEWVVYAKRTFSKPEYVMQYLGRYTHKIAISNHRLMHIDKAQVTFKYKDYKQDGKTLFSFLKAQEFLRRFCLHILPKGFVRMRHYGILASKNKTEQLNIAKKQLKQTPWKKVKLSWEEIAKKRLLLTALNKCPKCKKGDLKIVQVIHPERGPPIFKIQANLNFVK
jgi:predicted Zn-ribbon and HTH transcriptional regulator